MDAKGLTPILNVSDLAESFAWFARLGWQKRWEWGDPPGFGAVGDGPCEIFLCHDGQGGRGRSSVATTFGPDGSDAQDKGVWMSVWVGDVDEVHRRCLEQGLEVTFPPTDMPWRVREMHVRHPDGHVFRISRGIDYVSVAETLEETLLHTFEEVGGGVASPHTPRTLRHIRELEEKHGIDYDCHASYRFVEG